MAAWRQDVYILDRDGQPPPTAESGEIHIGGMGARQGVPASCLPSRRSLHAGPFTDLTGSQAL